MVSVGIIGASGYTGAELLRLVRPAPGPRRRVRHRRLAGRDAGRDAVPEPEPSAYPDLVFEPFDAARAGRARPRVPRAATRGLHGARPALRGEVGCIVDLSAAFRLKDASLYPRWYGFEHDQPELLADAVYGLPELYRDELKGARLIATPGCYVTAARLALAPLVRQDLIEPTGIIVDAASGVSGAGRGLKHTSFFATVDEDFTAYGLLDHRHTPEIEQVTGAQVLFTPHLAPMNRGILATCYARPAGAVTTESLLAALLGLYDDEPFVVVRPTSPSTKATLGTNAVHLTARFDERTGYVVVLVRDRQPRQGRVGRGAAGRQRRPRPARDGRADVGRVVPVSSRRPRRTPTGRQAAVLVEALPYIRRFSGRSSS